MFKAFSGALALALTLLILRWFFPELAVELAQVALKIIKIINGALDLVLQNLPNQ